MSIVTTYVVYKDAATFKQVVTLLWDIQNPVFVQLPRDNSLGQPVRLWPVFIDVDLNHSWCGYNGILQAADLVRLLSNRDNDPGDLQDQSIGFEIRI